MRPLDKRIVGRLYPRYSTLLQALNENARFVRWAKEHEPSEVFAGRGSVERFYRYVNDAAAGTDAPIDFLEFGVATGRTLRLWTDINRHEDSRFYGFDSFQGLPEDWVWARGGMPRGTYSTGGRPPSVADKRVECVTGLFQISLPPFLRRYRPKNRLIVHIDCDLYASTLFTLTQLDSLLEGGTVIFDEFDNLLHEFAAFQDYARSYRRRYASLARCGYFKKAAFRIGSRY